MFRLGKSRGQRISACRNHTLRVLTPGFLTHSNLVFGIFAALAEFERELISERTKAGLASARARGRMGGGQYKMTPAKLRLAMAAMGQRQTVVSELCKELGVTRQTLYRHLGPDGSLRQDGQKLLDR